jgi:hypothetical protein
MYLYIKFKLFNSQNQRYIEIRIHKWSKRKRKRTFNSVRITKGKHIIVRILFRFNGECGKVE